MTNIAPSAHEKAEWSRLAQAAYAVNLNSIGHKYSGAASIPNNAAIDIGYFDLLQSGYRAWLLSGFANAAPIINQHVAGPDNLYATDGLCHDSEPGTFNHECGRPAKWLGVTAAGFWSGYCDHCKQHGHEAKRVVRWQAR